MRKRKLPTSPDDRSLEDPSIDPGRLFDEVVYSGRLPASLLANDAEDVDESAWEVAALPQSTVKPQDLPPGALVVRRALGEGRLAWLQVIGQDVQPQALYGGNGRIRPDVLVLVRRTTVIVT